MSSKKAKLLIAAVWILSFLICFPPLVGWNDRKRTFYRHFTNVSIPYDANLMDSPGSAQFNDSQMYDYEMEECTITCELTNDKVIHQA